MTVTSGIHIAITSGGSSSSSSGRSSSCSRIRSTGSITSGSSTKTTTALPRLLQPFGECHMAVGGGTGGGSIRTGHGDQSINQLYNIHIHRTYTTHG